MGPIEKFLEISKDFPHNRCIKNPANGFCSYFVYQDNTPSQYQKRCQILILECFILNVYVVHSIQLRLFTLITVLYLISGFLLIVNNPILLYSYKIPAWLLRAHDESSLDCVGINLLDQ